MGVRRGWSPSTTRVLSLAVPLLLLGGWFWQGLSADGAAPLFRAASLVGFSLKEPAWRGLPGEPDEPVPASGGAPREPAPGPASRRKGAGAVEGASAGAVEGTGVPVHPRVPAPAEGAPLAPATGRPTAPATGAGPFARTAEQVLEEFGGASGLCEYWGWKPLPPGAPRPRLLYGTITGNNGQADAYELHFLEVSPFVSRIVALDPRMTQRGHPRNLSVNTSSPEFARFGDQLRHLVLESPIPGKTLPQLNWTEWESLLRPGKKPLNKGFVLEQWTRAHLIDGLKDAQGRWETNEADIVLIADSDEIPLPHSLTAMQWCEVPQFESARRDLRAGKPAAAACPKAKLSLVSQVYEYFVDCPTVKPFWVRPNAILAECLMNGAIDTEEVRTRGMGGSMSRVAARHVHNLGMSLEEIIFKYSHYVEPRVPRLDSGLDRETNQEMMWRGCDPTAPEIGPGQWHMTKRPSNDYISRTNRRGYMSLVDERGRRQLERPFALLLERPELAGRFIWKGHAELGNPFVGKSGGNHTFDH